MRISKFATVLVAATALMFAAACTDDEEGTVHVMVTAAPPATATAGTAFDVSWQVHNDTAADLHHTEIRVCEGASVADCGMGDTSSYTSHTGTNTEGTFTASVQLDTAGAYTVVAWSHVGENPHVSDSYSVDVQ